MAGTASHRSERRAGIWMVFLVAAFVLLPAIGRAQESGGGAPTAFRLTAWRQVTWAVVQPVQPISGFAADIHGYGTAAAPRYRVLLFRVTEIRTLTVLPVPRQSAETRAPGTDRATLLHIPRQLNIVRRDDLRFAPRLRVTHGFDPERANGSLRIGLDWLDNVIAGRD